MKKGTQNDLLINNHIIRMAWPYDEGRDSSKKKKTLRQRLTTNLTSGLFIKVEHLNAWVLDTNYAFSNMASKVRPKFFSPYVDEKILRSLQKRVSPRKISRELEASKGRFHKNMWLKYWR